MSKKSPTAPGIHEGTSYPSPITRIVALGYYDGPKEGFAQCGRSGPAYFFKCVGTDEGANEEIWIFTLAPVAASDLNRLIELYAQYQAPRWPVWAPIWDFPTEAIRKTLDKETEHVVASAGPPAWVVASHVALIDEIRVARKVNTKGIESITDWLAFLGLEEHSSATRARRHLSTRET